MAKQITSGRKLAVAIGRSESVVRKWLRDDRWPFARIAPWPIADVTQMKEWAARTLAENPATGAPDVGAGGDVPVSQLGPERRAKVAKLVIDVKQKQFNLDLARGLYHRTDECERRMLRKIHAVKQELLHIEQSAPADTPPHIRRWLKQRHEQICTLFAGPPPRSS